jgi:pantothenate kinase
MTIAYTLESRIVHWHHDRNLIHGSTDHQQFEKLLEEVEELRLNIMNSQPIVDDIGDIIVVLINLAHRNNLTLHDCMSHAYEDIRHRKGKMVDGLFVKELVDETVKS